MTPAADSRPAFRHRRAAEAGPAATAKSAHGGRAPHHGGEDLGPARGGRRAAGRRPAPGARGDQRPGLRRPAPGRPPASAGHCTLAIATTTCPPAPGQPDELSQLQLEALERNCAEFGVRLYGLGDRLAGHRARHRARAGRHPARHDGRRRLAHLHRRALGRSPSVSAPPKVEHASWPPRRCPSSRRGRCASPTWAGSAPAAPPRTSSWVRSGESAPTAPPGTPWNTPARPSGRSRCRAGATPWSIAGKAGARAGMIAPDDTTFSFLEGRPGAPADLAAAVEGWRLAPTA